MDIKTKITFVIGLSIKPSEKVGLITLITAGKPCSVSDLNNYNKCYKTLENYKELFKEHINSGLVELVYQNDSNGSKRNHFSLNNDVLEDLINNNF